MAGLTEGLRQLVLRAAVDSAWEIRDVEAFDQLAAAIRRKLVKNYVQMAEMLDKVLVVWHELNLWLESLQEAAPKAVADMRSRSEEHTSELQSRGHIVCRLLLEKKKIQLPVTIRDRN